jgi:hypothetical protein
VCPTDTLAVQVFNVLPANRAGIFACFHPCLDTVGVEIVTWMAHKLGNDVRAFVGCYANDALVFVSVDIWIKSLPLKAVCYHNYLLLAKSVGIVVHR